MRLLALENDASTELQTPVLVSFADSAMPAAKLSRAERDHVANLKFEHRRHDWLTGRAALKPLLRILKRSDDSAAVTFPDRQVSLSHGDGSAFAVGTYASMQGIGIDFEPLRVVNRRMANWFLSDAEINWLNEQDSGDYTSHLVRLWTIKEAAFKSHPENKGMSLNEFFIADPAEHSSNTIIITGGAAIQVACRKYGSGYLSIAIFGDKP